MNEEAARIDYLDRLINMLKDKGVRTFKDGQLEFTISAPMPVGRVAMPRAARLPTAGVLAEGFAPSPEEEGAY
jgi:hypothetical protein